MSKSVILSLIAVLIVAGVGFYVLKSPGTTSPSEVAGEATATCFVGGCSGQICSDEEGAMSTCEYKEEYACYKSSKCERQSSGQCGWTETPEFAICMNAVLYPNSDLK